MFLPNATRNHHKKQISQGRADNDKLKCARCIAHYELMTLNQKSQYVVKNAIFLLLWKSKVKTHCISVRESRRLAKNRSFFGAILFNVQ